MSIYVDVKMVADSVSPQGARISTLQLEYPRYIHSEVMTHRQFSRNAQSSRAIPVERLIKRLYDHEVVPDPKDFGLNKKGMQAGEGLPIEDALKAHLVWRDIREASVKAAMRLKELKVHKQWVNRILEPYSTIVTLITATADYWPHFLALRDHPDAEPSFMRLAKLIREGLDTSSPVERLWHLPYITEEERETAANADIRNCLAPISAARCARVSYVTHDGIRDLAADMVLYNTLATAEPPHESPLEHPSVARVNRKQRFANFTGWESWRHYVSKSPDRRMFRQEDMKAVLLALEVPKCV